MGYLVFRLGTGRKEGGTFVWNPTGSVLGRYFALLSFFVLFSRTRLRKGELEESREGGGLAFCLLCLLAVIYPSATVSTPLACFLFL